MNRTLFIGLLFFIFKNLFSQSIFFTDEKVNEFIQRLNQKKIIKSNSSVFPFLINNLQIHFTPSTANLTILEFEESVWYAGKYLFIDQVLPKHYGELKIIEPNFKFRLYPIAGYGISSFGAESGHTRKIGAHIDAYLGDNLGIMFEYLDTGEYGNNLDRTKEFTRSRGHWLKEGKNYIEFSDVRGQLNYNWDWGVISLKKDYNRWGHGRFGQLILSDKAASYPQIHLRLNPTDWLSINYIHGWLNSLVIDSSQTFYYSAIQRDPFQYEEYRSKYIAANYISIMPNDWLTFSLGNSFIYSGELRPEMFLPVMYYKVMDHNTGRGDKGDGNGIIYFDLGINYPANYLFYATAVIDVLNIRDMLKGIWYSQWFGFTIGASAVDLGVENSELIIEYTKTNPWLYENKYTITNYKHLAYTLGHWIGQNADLISIQYNYKIARGMNVSLTWETFRKGDMYDLYYAYIEQTDLPFLYGDNRIDQSIKLNFDYEFLYNVYLQGYWMYSDISDEKAGRTLEFQLGKKHSFSLALSYGVPF